MKTEEEWLSESLRAKSGPENELVWIRDIQQDAYECGWIEGLYRAANCFKKGSDARVAILSIVSRANCGVGMPTIPTRPSVLVERFRK